MTSDKRQISLWLDDKDSDALDDEDIATLEATIQQAVPGCETEWFGVGGEWHQIVHVGVETLAEVVALTTPIVLWLRKRIKKSPDHPKTVFLHGPDGRILKRITVRRSDDGEVYEEHDPQ